jgi:hypothetical protein
VLAVLECLVEEAYTRDKDAALRGPALRLNVARHLWRLAHELALVSARRYEHGARLMSDLGRQVGCWRRSRQVPDATP